VKGRKPFRSLSEASDLNAVDRGGYDSGEETKSEQLRSINQSDKLHDRLDVGVLTLSAQKPGQFDFECCQANPHAEAVEHLREHRQRIIRSLHTCLLKCFRGKILFVLARLWVEGWKIVDSKCFRN